MTQDLTNEPIDVTPEDSVTPVYLVQITPEEEAGQLAWNKEQEGLIAVEQAKVDAKQSALAKLAKLGLTEEEAKAVIGL